MMTYRDLRDQVGQLANRAKSAGLTESEIAEVFAEKVEEIAAETGAMARPINGALAH